MPRPLTGGRSGAPPGKFRKPKPLTEEAQPARGPSWTIPNLRRLVDRPPVPPVPLAVRVHVTDELELYANENGSLYFDPGLRSPSGFQIFERGGEFHEGVDDEDD